MWQNYISGILALFLIIIIFLGFPMFWKEIITAALGFAIAILSFWSASNNSAK